MWRSTSKRRIDHDKVNFQWQVRSRTSVSGGCASRLLPHHFLHAFFHFLGRGLRLVRADHPRIAVRIHYSTAAVAPEHIQHWTLWSRADFGRFFNYLVDVFDVDIQSGRRGADTLGAASAHCNALWPSISVVPRNVSSACMG